MSGTPITDDVRGEAAYKRAMAILDEEWRAAGMTDEQLERSRLAARMVGKFGVGAIPLVRRLLGVGDLESGELLRTLEGHGDWVRAVAARALHLGSPDVAALMECIRHGGADAREAAASTLEALTESTVSFVAALRGCLSDADHFVRLDAAEALATIGRAAAEAVPELTQLLEDEKPEVRRAAELALTRVRG